MMTNDVYENAQTGERTYSRVTAEMWVSQGYKVWHYHPDGGTTYMGNYWC